MARELRSAGGWPAIRYTIRKGREAGGIVAFARRLYSRNTCKTCALGMGGQLGGMRDESGHFPELCKKSAQAQAADMQPPIPEAFFRATPVAQLERLTGRELEALGRLGFPLLWQQGDTHVRRVGWDDAYRLAAGALREAQPARTFFYTSGRSSNEAAFLLQCFARVYGTNNINNCSYYCHQASGVGLEDTLGTGTATVVLDDLERTDLAVIIGANPASNHPRLLKQLVHLRRRGGRVIVINPMKELGLVRFRVPSDWRSLLFGSEISDVYLQPHIGSGIAALLKLLLKGIIERGACDQVFLAAHVEGWAAVEADVHTASRDDLLAACGVPPDLVERTIDALVRSRHTIFAWGMGVTQHAHGVDNVHAIVNLALSRGMVGKPGAGLLPLRGHSNVQGIGSVGMTPTLQAAFARRLEGLHGVTLPDAPGQHPLASVEAAARGEVEAAVLLGGNLCAASPDRSWAARALQRIGTTIAITTKLNQGHIHGRGRTALILPTLARDEGAQCTTQESMFSYVRLSEGGHTPASADMRPEVEIIATLARRVLPAGPVDFGALTDHAAIRAAIARVVPHYERIGEIDRTRQEVRVTRCTFPATGFPTPTGKARAVVTPVPDFAPRGDELRLMTLRSEGQFNTVVYEDADLYRGNERRDVVMMNEGDVRARGLHRDQRVVVATAAGQMEMLVRVAPLPPGNLAMYYPEANVLIPRRIDPHSATPAFKSVLAMVRPVAA